MRNSKYICKNCDTIFEKEEGYEKRVCLEDWYGVGGQFESSTYIMTIACPECLSVEVDDYEEEEDWEDEDDE